MNKKTYNIIVIGCQMNKSDGERIAGYLEELGLVYCDNKYRADLIVVVTCGVRQSAEDRIYGLIPRIKKENPQCKIILTGCLVDRRDVKKRLEKFVDKFLSIKEMPKLQFLISKKNLNDKIKISNEIQNQKSKIKNCNSGDYLQLIPKYSNSYSAFVPIGNGCNNFCSYCVVPYARGREVYRPAEEIINEVKDLAERGYREVVLIAQNVNSYKDNFRFPPRPELGTKAIFNFQTNQKSLLCRPAGKIPTLRAGRQNSKFINFPKLLRLINEIPGDFWIRFMTSHPKDMSGELINAVADCEKVCKHIHLPAQAGDDKILKMMNRRYTVKQYVNLVNKIRTRVNTEKDTDKRGKDIWQPAVAITTDVIVGFPGETRRQFANTKKLFAEIKFDMAYIAQYSARPGTAAEKLKDDVSTEEKKRREDELNTILKKTALANNKKYLGKSVKVLVAGKNKKGKLFGQTETNKNVKIIPPRNSSGDFIGKFIIIKINKAKDFGLEGRVGA